MINKFIALSLVVVGLVGCAADFAPQGPATKSDRYLRYKVCTELNATQAYTSGKNIHEAIETGISQCEREALALIRIVEKEVMNNNGWTSLHPSVRPALLDDLRERTRGIIAKEFRRNSLKDR